MPSACSCAAATRSRASIVLRSSNTPRSASPAYVSSQAINTSGHLPPAQNVDICCIGSFPDNNVRTLMPGCLFSNSATTRILAAASAGLAEKKKVSALSSPAQPAVHSAIEAPSVPAPRSSVRRRSGTSNIALPKCVGHIDCILGLLRLEAEDGDLPPHKRRLGAIVAVPGVNLLRERKQERVLVRIGDLGRDEFIAAELACGVCLQVVIPVRVAGSPVVRRDENRVTPVVEVGQLDHSRLTRPGTGAHEWCAGDHGQGCWMAPAGDPVQPRVEAGDAVGEELSRAGAREALVGPVDQAALLVGIDVTQRHAGNPTRRSGPETGFLKTRCVRLATWNWLISNSGQSQTKAGLQH